MSVCADGACDWRLVLGKAALLHRAAETVRRSDSGFTFCDGVKSLSIPPNIWREIAVWSATNRLVLMYP
jgi:hypothetical protein